MGGLTDGVPESPMEPSINGKSRPSRKGMPIVLLIIRYFLYVLLILALLFAGIYMVWINLGARGDIFWANYGEQHLEKVGQSIGRSAAIDESLIPAAYWYRTYDHQGHPTGGDMKGGMAGEADQLAADHWEHRAAKPSEERGKKTGRPLATRAKPDATYAVYATADGRPCVLAYRVQPQWASRQDRDRYPNPQNLLLTSYGLALLLTLLLVGLRAAHVISSKLKVFNQVADDIGRQDLDASLPRSNVLEINRVLESFDRMRATLKESLEKTWTAQESQRRQVAALAHDLKTPLTIMRGNADLLGETGLSQEQQSYLDSIEDAIAEMADYARAISQGSVGTASGRSEVTTVALRNMVDNQARGYLSARGLRLESEDRLGSDTGQISGNSADLVRAIMNIVANAADYSPDQGLVRLTWRLEDGQEGRRALVVTVRDQGPGFSSRALVHATEWLYQADSSRHGSGGHHGIGLAAARSTVESAEGHLTLGNATDGDGAVVTVSFPVQ
ncbi:HAMP domain-containing sensor histidine kinase [Bifidobacterium sp. ESL0819]|uniref:HAMP domain-containing sensor histidine kinase n=1 Tax=Bifidobacterium sp. ESL0819 TaxID=3448589 RepID=UPI004042839C